MSTAETEPLLPAPTPSDAPAKRRRGNGLRPRSVAAYSALLLVLVFGLSAAIVLQDRLHPDPPVHNGPPGPFPFPIPDVPPGPRNPSYLAKGKHGAVAAEQETCSDIGVDVLRDGGSATDAGIAAVLCVGVVSMFSSGIGGGGFLTVRPASPSPVNPVLTIDFRETAPGAAHPRMFVHDPQAAQIGGLAVGVPGELAGLAEAHKRFGKLSWERVVRPAAELAEGWRVGRELERRIKMFGDFLGTEPLWKDIFAPNGTLLREGDWISRPAYARTLHTIAEQGPSAFYHGPIASHIAAAARAHGGILTAADLASYKALVEPALQGSYRGRAVYTSPAPTSGPILLFMLNVLERWAPGETAQNVHRLVETMKFAFAARTELADPKFNEANAPKVARIPTKEYADEIAKLITPNTHEWEYYDPRFDLPEPHGTTHVSAVDRNGSAMGITSTVNLVFGSRVMDPETGIILNDEMDDFSIPGVPNAFGLMPSPFNYPEPGKRSLSSTAPTVVERADGSLYAVLGGSGGSRIFGSVAQVLLNLERGLDVSEAVEEPRLHDQLFPHTVTIESGFPNNLVRALEARGHNTTVFNINLGVAEVQAIVRDEDGTVWAASDSRKNGVAAAY